MKKLKKILSVLALIVLVGSDFLTSISYALDDLLEDSVVVQTENEEAESVENEEENVDEKDSEDAYEGESIGEENEAGETVESTTGDIVEEGIGEVSEIGSGEVEELTEETVEGVTGDVEELTGEVVESTEIGEETVIENMTYNEEPITGEKTYNDVTVRVEALSGTFPEGTELKIEPIKWWNLSSLKDKLVEEKEEIKEDTTIVAFDITFRYEGEEVQPKDGEKVKVMFDYSRNVDLVKADKNKNQEVKVYHIEDKDEEGNKVAQGEEKVVDVTNKQESTESGIAVADAESFSVYLVTYGNEDPEFFATLVGEDSARNNFHYKTISISDGENTYTLMDRNLGARVAWNTGTYAFDDKSNYNTEDDYYGYYYQWGNNYGFSNTQKYGNVISDAIPSNYVSSSWSTSNLGGYNLRGDTTNTESARQGPCPRGWHVPSANEWEAIKKAWCISYNNTENCQGAGRQFAEALQMPTAGYRYYNYGKFIYSSSGSNGYYWSSTSNDNSKANYLFFRSSNVNINTDDRVNGLQVRCLKNNTDAVTLYLNPNGGRVEDAIIDADEQGKVILPTATRNEYNFDGWYDAVDGGNRRGGSGDEITINEDTDLYAHWSEIIPNPIVIFNNGADITEFEVESGGTLTNEQVQQILNLTHTKATFDGWYKDLEFTQPFDFNTIITEDISLYAKWTCKEGYITLQGNGGPDMNCFEYETISYEYDGNKHILMDRNLGAQMIGFGREADLKSYGYYYQWGNNYGFGSSITPITSNIQVDCTNINPSTYSRSTFITGSSDFDWCSPRNDNLWGGNGDGLGNNRGLDAISATVIDRQGPCPRGWHVPSAGERQTLLTYWVSLNGVTRDSGTSYEYRLSNFTRFSDDFKMPLVGRRAYEGAQLGGGGSVYLWSSSPNVDDDLFWLARHFNLSNTDFLPYANSRSYRAYGMPVRCFMNNPKTITFNYNGGEGENFEINVPSGTKVTAPADPTNGNHIFAGWYEGTDDGQTLSDTAFDFNEEITQNVDLYAKWVSCEDGEIYSPELGKCVARWHELVSLTDDNTTTTVGSDESVDGLPTTITVIENNILELPEGEALSEAEGKELVGDITIDFGGKDAKFSHLVKVKIPVEGSSKAYVKVKHVSSDEYNYDGLTRYIEASCDDGNIENSNDKYHGEYMDVESGYVSIYTCEASDFAAFGLPKVTFEPENGSGTTVVEVENGATVNSGDIPTVTKEGYNFSGWYLTGAESAFDFSGTAITGDITLYAKWEEGEGVTYTVTFDANRGTFANTPAAQTVTDGNYAEEPQTHPELPGYIFTGWWTEPRGGTQWNFANDTVTGNITLYAHWTYKEIFGDLDVYMIDSNGSLIKYVMMDRNLGATGVYNKNFDSQNPNSFGFVYQWGNNYGFPRCNGNATCNYSPITDTQVSVDIVENYIPSKFASSIWIGKNGGNGSSKSWHSNSGNVLKYLWGNGNTTDMQGPCPDGYHVPLASETNNEGGLFRVWGNIYDKTINTITGGKGLGFTFLSYDQELFSSQFLFPHAGNHKKGNTKEEEQNMCGDYWTATPSGTENAINMWFCKDGDNSYYDANGNFLFTNNSQRNNGSTLRCFKNSTSSANLNIVDGGKKGLITVEKVGGVATINAIKVPENTDASGTDLIFDGWYTSPTFESNTMKTGGDILSDSVTALYAKWNCPDGSPYNSNNQCALGILVRFMDGETEYTRSIVLSGEEVSAPATNPEKRGYNFLGWFESGANSPFVFTGTPITGDLDLYAHWDINNYDVNASVATGDEDKGYLSGMGSTGISLTGLYDYGTELVFIAIPELGYVFDYWMNGDQVLSGTDLGDGKNQLTVTVDQVLDIIAFFKETPTPYTVEHYQQNLSQTGYDFVWSGIMYGIANEQTNATGTNYTGFTLSGNLADYQTGINADGSTVVRLYYNRVSVVSYLVSFNADRGTFVSGSISQSVASGTLVTPLTEEQKPVFPGYRVDGWYKTNPRLDSNAEEWIFDQDVVTGDITLYAHWTNNYDVRDLDIYFVVDDSTGSYYTTLDRDVGASQLGVAGYQYQWGNNHGFKACTTSKCNSFPGGETTSTNQVDVSDYDPISNPYSSNIYIIQAGNSNKESNWAIGNVNRRDNLWGGVSGTNAAMQGPCPEGYHIPTSGDWEDIYASWSDINFGRDGCKNGSLKTCATKLVEDLLLTPHGRRDHEAKVDFLTAASYWSSSPNNGASKAYGVYINSNESTDSKAVQVPNLDGRIRARAVRCVKNEYNTPLIIKINGGTGASLSVYSGSLHYLTNPTKEGYEFSGWYSNLTGNVKIEDGSTLPQGTITLYAKWISNNEAEYIFNASGGIFNSTSTEELVHVYTLNDEINSGDIETPIRTGYNFLGWYDESGEPVSFPIVVTGNLNLYAHWEESGQTEATITVNHHWMNIGGSGYTIHETEYISGDIGDEFTATEKEYTGFTADPNNEKTIIISGDNNIIDLYYYRHWGYFYFLMDQFSVENITISGCDNGTCWYGEDVQLTVQEATGYTFNSWGIPTSITLPEGLDRTQKTLSFTMPEISDMQIRWSISLTAIPYTITYHLDGGEEVEHNQTGYTAGDFLIYVTDPVKTGYDFLGWTGGVIDGPQLSSLTTGLVIVVRDMYVEVGDREYYANWSIKNYEVDASVSTGDEGYLSGMGTTGISLTGLYDYATELVFIAIPELGYVFDYWKNGDTVLSGTDLGDGTNQLTVVVDQILDIIAFFKPSENMPYTVEHYKQNLDQTGYEFAWSGTMYGTTNEQTNATGTDYEGFTLSGDLVGYQTGVKADGTTIVRLYYNRNTYTVTRNMWDGHLNRRKIDENVPYGTTPIFEWDDEDKYTPKRGREVDTDDIKYDFTFTGWVKSGSSEIIKDLTTQIVTGDVRYIAQYDTGYRYYEVRYHTDEGTGTMEPQSLQLYSSGTLNKNKFIRTGYIFSGWWYEYGDGIEVFYEDEQEINLGVEDDVIKSDAEWEDPLYLDVYAQWKPSTGTKVTVNYYLKDLDADNNVLIDTTTEYATGVEFTGTADSFIDSILTAYGTGINGYEYSTSIVYGPDYPDGVETGTTTILADGSRVIDMYYVPSIYQFTLNSESHSSTAGSSESTGYYYGANVRLSGDSNDDCFTWSGWTTTGIALSDNTVKQTLFTMPANDVEVTPSVRENTYNIIFNGNGNTSGEMLPMNGVRCTESTGLTLNSFRKIGYHFTGWSKTSGDNIREYTDRQTVSGLSKNDGENINLYAVWDANPVSVHIFHLSETLSGATMRLETGSVLTKVGAFYSGEVKTFPGFTYNPEDSRNKTGIIASYDGSVNEILLYYKRNQYPVRITNEGEGITNEATGSGDYLYEEPVTISVRLFTGWEFVDWTVIEGDLSGVDLSGTTLSFNMPAEQVRISPNLNHIEYTLSFDSASGTAVANQTYYYNDLLSGLDNAITTKTGYDFAGWYLSGVLYTSGSTMPAENITLTAVWDINEYEVNASVATGDEDKGYLSGMGSTGISLTGLYDYATELVFIAIPELGYVFDYWKNGDTVLSGTDLGDGTNQLTVVVDQVLDIIAFFKPADDTPYTVEHYQANVELNGYDFVWSGIMYGTTNELTNATGTDYEGFSLHNGDISEYQTGIKADGSTVVRLYYDRNRYIVTWNTWNGHEVTKTDVAYGQHPHFDLTPPARDVLDPEDEDYDFTFTGWTKSGVSGIVDLETEIVTGDITYTAAYDRSLKYYEVRYYPGEGTGEMEIDRFQLHTSGTLSKNTFTRTGYIFSGWVSPYYLIYEDEQEINMGRADGLDFDSSGNMSLNLQAQWTPKTDTEFTVNCYSRELDPDHGTLMREPTFLTGIVYEGKTDSGIDIRDYSWGCLNISGYNEGHQLSGAIIYGSDLSGGVETGWEGSTTILADESRVINMYIVPKKVPYTANPGENCGNKGTISDNYYYGTKIRLEASPYECYSFSGWIGESLPSTLNKTLAVTEFYMPNARVTTTPTVRENRYNIIFSGNGSTSGTMSNLSVLCTSGTLSPNTFEREGYTFAGWSTTSTGTVEFNDKSEVYRLNTEDNGSITLYAVWDINNYEVTGSVATGQENMGYLSGESTTGSSLTGLYEYGRELIFVAVPELGYLFDYWEVNNGTGDNLPEGVTASGNQLTVIVDQILDIVAHFTENVKTVRVNYYAMNTGGTYSGVEPSRSKFTGLVGETKYAEIDVPEGFYLDTGTTTNTGIVISENAEENIINIYYARNKYYISLGYTGAFVNPNSVEVTPTPIESGYYYGECVHFEAIVNTGYVFKQWRVNGVPVAGGADGVDFNIGAENINLVVDGDLIVYSIDYYTDPGYSDPMHENPHTYTVLSGEIEIYNPIAGSCYEFLGWTGGTTGDWIFTPKTGLVIDSNIGGDREYYANWNRKSYEVTLSVDPLSGGTVTGAGIYRCMGTIELHATPNTGYHFVGWYDNMGNLVSDNSMYVFYAPEDDLGTGLTAKFEINQYYVSIDKVGSGGFQPESAPSGWYNHGTEITVKASPAYGYKLQKWSKDGHDVTGENDELYTGFNLSLVVTKTGYITVYYEPETYNIIYMDGDSILSGLTPSTYTVENHVYSGDLPTITKDGYTFEGWFTEYPRQQYNRVQEIGEVPVNLESVTIYAGWTPKDYNIHYYLSSGEIINWSEYYPYEFYQSYTVETSGTNLPIPQKSGYVFSGWLNHGEPISTFGGGMTGDLNLYPTWRSAVMDITVNYYEMNTSGKYYPSEYTYYTGYHYTGFTESEFIVPDYTTTGFSFDYYVLNGYTGYSNPTLVVSGNENANVIDVYYKRHHNYVQVMGDPGSNINVSSCSGYSGEYYYNCEYYFGQEVTIQHGIYDYDEGYEYSGWYVDSEYPLPDGVELTTGGVTFNMPDHDVHLYLYTNHILYKLTFTGYEGSEVTNSEYIYLNLTGENYLRFDTEFELPNLNKPGYNFLGWNSGDYNVWSPYYTLYPDHPTWHMPSHDVELTAVFSGRTNMHYYRYYYLQDIEGTGYTYSGDLIDSEYDGVTNQEMPGRFEQKYITGFEYTGFGYSGEITNRWDLRPYIKATGDNFIDYYYDRKVSLVDVFYDNGILSVIGTGYYRYEAPVTVSFITKTGYEFSGIGYTSWYPDYDTGNSISFIMPDGGVVFNAYSKPIEYTIEYESNGGELNPYSSYTNYTVESHDLFIGNPYKDGYTFLGWTGGVISGEQLSGLTTQLVIPEGSVGNRKYFANWEPAEVNVTVNYYTKNIDPELNILTGGAGLYKESVIYTGLTDDVVNIQSRYGTGIEGYDYTTAIVYGSDLPDGIETGSTTILGDGSRSIDIYYIPKKYNFTVIQGQNTTTAGTSISTGYYYGATVRLSGDSNNDCYIWSGWITNGITLSDNTLNQTGFTMPANNVIVTPSVREMTYNIVFSGNGSTSGEMSSMMGVRCTESTGLILNSFQKIGYRFTGWSTIPGSNTGEYTDGQVISGLSMNDGENVNLYAVWDIDWYTVTFDLNGGSLTGDMTETKDYTIETPEISLEDYIPVKTGYNFSGWYKGNDLTNSIAGGETGNYTLTAKWEADSDTEFKVEYYLQNVEDDGYTFAETGLQTGTTNTTGYADITKEFTGFIFSGGNQNNITSGVVVGDGSLVLKLYYDRKEYNVTTGEVEHGIMEGGAGSQRYGKRITFTAHPDAGYVISKWLRDGTKIISGGVIWTGEELEIEVDTGMEIGVEFKAKEDTPYYVKYYKEKLEGGYNVWTGTYSGTTDQEAIASELIFTGFTYDSGNVDNVTTGNIDGDGSRVLVMYYTRNINNVVYVYTGKVPTGQVVPVASGYKYESNVTVAEAPSVSGYNFSWSTGVSSFIMPDEEVTITGTWIANTGTKYAVKHMLQNVEDDEYTQTGENQILSGETDELTDAQANNYTGFVAQAVTQTGIRGDESTVVEIYYDREIYEVTTGETEHGSVSGETGSQRYGKVITFTAHPEIGYVVSRWLRDGEEILRGGEIWTGEEIEIEVDTGMEISVEFKAREDTPYYVEYYKENLDGGYDVWTGIQYGTSDTEGVAQELSFTGFTYDSGNVNNVITGNIDGDGSKVLKMYYNREIYTITWLNEDGTDMDTTTVKYGEVPTHADPTQPADAHYTYKFKGWNPEPTFATGEISYRATYEHIVNKHTITWKNDDGSLIDKTMVEYGTIPTHAKPTKSETEDYRYIFAGWDPEVVAVVGDAEYTAVFNTEEKEKSSKGGGMSGGGGRGGNIDNSDNQHGSAEESSDLFTGDNDTNSGNINDEPLSLYEWVHENDITTMDTLEYADPDGLLTRGHLAKMVVNYMVNVLGRKIPYDVTYNCRYWGDDESSRESDEIRDYATKACAFGVMGINMEDNKFLPNSIVTRAEFGTVMSRVLRGDKYDITDTDNRSYYENHLQALKKDNILTQIANPETRWEIRKWVWLVFRRIVEKYKK